jgi:hypothetical protein
MRGTIVIAGSLAQKLGHGGHTWVYLQYLLGFKRLGWDVPFLDQLGPGMCVDADGRPCPVEAVAQAEEVSRDYGRISRAARALAEAYFDSDKVLNRLLARLAAC